MKVNLSVSAAKKLLSIKTIKEGLTPSEWKTFEKWLKQESVKPDSSDFWKNGGAKEDALVYKVLGMFPKSSRVWKSPEPFRAAIDACKLMYLVAGSSPKL